MIFEVLGPQFGEERDHAGIPAFVMLSFRAGNRDPISLPVHILPFEGGRFARYAKSTIAGEKNNKRQCASGQESITYSASERLRKKYRFGLARFADFNFANEFSAMNPFSTA